MAAIFQLRRGSGSVSLVDGELYVSKGPDSLQYAVGEREITLAKLDELNTGSLYLKGELSASGNITASNLFVSGNAKIDGNLTLGGTITIGDTTNDSVVFIADLSSSIIPDSGSTYDLGSSVKTYRNVYATSISGAIAATNGVISGSSQLIEILTSLNSYTQSNDTNVANLFQTTASLNAYTSSNDGKVNSLISATGSYAITGSNTFRGNQIVSASIDVSGSVNADGFELDATSTTNIPALNSTFNSDFSSSASTFIKKSLVLGDGKVLVAGRFESIDGHTTNGIARFNSNGTIDTSFTSPTFAASFITPQINTFVTQSDNKIIVGGNFDEVNGDSNRVGLVRLNANGTLDNSFTSQSWGSFGEVRDIVIQNNDKIVCVGYFTSGSRRINTDGTLDTSFNVSTGSNQPSFFNNDYFHSVALLTSGSDQAILIGGSFTQWGSLSDYDFIVKLHPSGALDSGFAGTNLNITTGNSLDRIKKIKVGDDGYIYVAGRFRDTLTGPNGRNAGFARLTTTNEGNGIGAFESSFRTYITGSDQNNPGTQYVNDFDFYDGDKILLGGSFTTFGNPATSITSANRFAILSQNSGNLIGGFSSSTYRLNTGSVDSVTLLSNDNVLVGGTFTSASFPSTAREGLASFKLAGLGDVTTTSEYNITANTTRLLVSSSNTHFSGDVNIIGSVTASVFSGSFVGAFPSQDGRLTQLETASGSAKISIAELNSYTSSLKTAITASGTNVTINGNLTVKGTTTQIDSTTLNIGDNIIELNYGGSQTLSGIYTKDATGVLSSGSLLWNSTTDRWIAGVSGSESTILLAGGDSVISSSLQLTDLNAFSQSTNTRLGLLETSTGSLNTFTSSANGRLELLETSTGSLNTFSSSTLGRLNLIETSTGSLNTFSSSTLGRLNLIETSTGSLNTFTSSANGRLDLIETSTGSLNTFTSSANSRLNAIEISTASLNVVTASLIISASQLYVSTSLMTASVEDHEERIAYLEGIGGISGGNPLTQLHIFSASINTFTASIAGTNAFTTSTNIRLNNIEAATSSYETKGRGLVSGSSQLTSSFAITGSNSFDGNQWITGSLLVSQNITGSASASFVSLAVNTTTPTQKIHLKGAVGIENGTTGGNTADQFVFGYAGSNLTQYTHKIQTGHDAQAALNRMDFLLANSSNTWKTPLQLRPDVINVSGSLIVTGSINGLINATNGVVSGSLQVLGGSGIFSGSSQVNADSITNFDTNVKDKLNIDGVISGSSQIITANSVTLGTHTTGNYVEVISGSANQITVAGSGLESAVVTLSLPQNIHTSADIQFNSLGIGTAASTTTGEIRATGDITAFYSSDIRLKENIQPIQNALEKIESISGNTYDWKEGYDEIHSHKGNDVGVIAQEIEQILPQIVTNRDNGYKAVQYEKIIPLLIEAIKELSARINSLENK